MIYTFWEKMLHSSGAFTFFVTLSPHFPIEIKIVKLVLGFHIAYYLCIGVLGYNTFRYFNWNFRYYIYICIQIYRGRTMLHHPPLLKGVSIDALLFMLRCILITKEMMYLVQQTQLPDVHCYVLTQQSAATVTIYYYFCLLSKRSLQFLAVWTQSNINPKSCLYKQGSKGWVSGTSISLADPRMS